MEQKRGLRSSWVWLLVIFTAASLIDAAFFGQIVAFTPLHLKTLGLTPDEVAAYTGLLASLTWAVGIPFLPLWGALADRYSRQPVIARSFLAFLVAGAVMLIARDVWLFSAGRALMSLALGNSGLMMTTLAERVPKHRVGLAFAIMNSAAPIGYFAGPLAGGPVVDAWGLPALIAINMALIALVTLGIAFGYHDPYRGRADGSLLHMAVESVGLIARAPSIRALFVAIFALFLGWQIVLPYVPLAVTDIYHGTDPGTAIGIVTGAGGLAAVLIGPAAGALSDRYGRRRVLYFGAALGALLLPLPVLARSLTGLAAAWGAANGVLSAIFALSFTLLSDAAAADIRGRVMSFAYLPANIGATVGPALGAALISATVTATLGSTVWWLFPIGAVMTVLGMGVMAWAARQAQSGPAPAPADESQVWVRRRRADRRMKTDGQDWQSAVGREVSRPYNTNLFQENGMTRWLEIRSFNLKPGARAEFHRLFVERSMPLNRLWQMDVVAYGPSEHDRDSYYVMRSFDSLEERARREEAFYASAGWRQGPREAVLALVENYTTVVLEVDDATVRDLKRQQVHPVE